MQLAGSGSVSNINHRYCQIRKKLLELNYNFVEFKEYFGDNNVDCVLNNNKPPQLNAYDNINLIGLYKDVKSKLYDLSNMTCAKLLQNIIFLNNMQSMQRELVLYEMYIKQSNHTRYCSILFSQMKHIDYQIFAESLKHCSDYNSNGKLYTVELWTHNN
jgi:hypothetical protein